MTRSNNNNVLVVVAHPDDETLGMGGTIKKFTKKGASVNVLVVTDGVTERFTSREKVREQEKCTLAAAKVLGIKKIFFGKLPDQKLDTIPLSSIANKISEVVRKLKPQKIYTHFYNDVNQDHRRVYEAVMIAARPLPEVKTTEILSFEEPSSTEWMYPYTYSPNFYENIADTLEDKINAFLCYKNEIKEERHPRHIENIKHLAKLRGAQVGLTAAESFVLVRKIIRK